MAAQLTVFGAAQGWPDVVIALVVAGQTLMLALIARSQYRDHQRRETRLETEREGRDLLASELKAYRARDRDQS